MKISQKGLYALKALMLLARRYDKGAVKIREIAADEELPEKFLELILLELKHARIVESTRGAQGGYRLKRPPMKILSAKSYGRLTGRWLRLKTRSRCGGTWSATRSTAQASGILDHTSLADISHGGK